MLGPGDNAWGARLQPHGQDYFQYTVSEPTGDQGGTSAVFQLLPRTRPPLVAKLYNDQILNRIHTDRKYAQRIFVLATHRDELAHALPFATWPRRLIFDRKKPVNPQTSVLGFTMERLDGTTSIADYVYQRNVRLKATPSTTAYIAISMADQLARMHRHPWTFVFGDMSQNNIHISADGTRVHFIDTDGFQFDYNNSQYLFTLSGLTPGFKSPGADASLAATGRVTTTHDDFVLAILIFMLLMADKGCPTHPFSWGNSTEDSNIEQQRFPLADPVRFPLPPAIVEAWNKLPKDIRDTFIRTFTGPVPVRATEWVKTLSDYRRCL